MLGCGASIDDGKARAAPYILEASHDSRAQSIITTTYNLLREQASKIDDEEIRRSFFENVAVHREIVEIVEGEASIRLG
jgi:hypothetical protein